MKRVRHVRAGKDEWIKVDRSSGPDSGGDLLAQLVFYAICAWLAIWLISKILPLLLGAVVILGILSIFGRE